MTPSFASRLPFLVAVALIAAALADPLVESVSNTGVFGGRYDDNNHLGVVPTLLLGGMLALEIATLRCLDVWRRTTRSSRDWLVDAARDMSTRAPAHDLPWILAMQIAALFVLEGCEQWLAGGRLLGGTAWLGGPILFSLGVHALVGAGCTFALGRCVRSIVRAFASLVRTALRFGWLSIARASSGCSHVGNRVESWLPFHAPQARQSGGRAPPLPMPV